MIYNAVTLASGKFGLSYYIDYRSTDPFNLSDEAKLTTLVEAYYS